jgi:Domain of unknown function (DUF5666)
MTRTVLAFTLASLVILGSPASNAVAQEAKMARGTVTAVAADSLTVKVRDQEMKFGIDAKTLVVAEGAGTKSRQAAAAGKPGPVLAEIIKTGQAVEVQYLDAGGVMHASRVRRITSPGTAGGSIVAARPATETANGTVKSVSADSFTITGSAGGGGTFTQTFTIDRTTKVVGVGAGTATAAKGGSIGFNELVGAGDRVSVMYSKAGSRLHADDVRVTSRATRTTK